LEKTNKNSSIILIPRVPGVQWAKTKTVLPKLYNIFPEPQTPIKRLNIIGNNFLYLSYLKIIYIKSSHLGIVKKKNCTKE